MRGPVHRRTGRVAAPVPAVPVPAVPVPGAPPPTAVWTAAPRAVMLAAVLRAARTGMMGVAARTAVVTVAAVLTLVGLPAAAQASAALVAASPADGAALATAPREVTLAYSARPDVDESHVSVQDAAGKDLTAGALGSAGAEALRVPVVLRPGEDYTIAFHVVFTDGTNLIGLSRFSVGTGVPPVQLSSTVVDRTRDSVRQTHSHSPDFFSAMMLVLYALVLGAVVVMFALRRPTDKEALRVLREPTPDGEHDDAI